MKTTKQCKICLREMPKGLNSVCSTKCQKEKEKNKRKNVKLKKSESVTVIKKKLWKIISEYIRRKGSNSDGINSCVTCGDSKQWKELQAGHFVPSGASSYLRYSEPNIHPQCYHCNINLGSNPIEYRIYMINRYGEKFVEQMIDLRNEPISLKSYDLLILKDIWQEKLDNINN